MFSVVLQGGIGNRLFQLAMGFGYEKKYGNKFVLCKNEVRDYRDDQKGDHSYFLRDIEIVEQIFDTVKVDQPCYYYDIPKYENVCFNGYFQTDKYFKNIRSQILEQFSCPIAKRKELFEKYPNLQNCIFLHIRRGDYVNHWLHYIDLSKYYDYCLKQFKDVEVLVCSDDKEWCKQNYPNFNILDENEVNTLWIMSLCGKGGICSNSSFSWWGSWLNENKDATFFYPNKQFNDPGIIINDLHSDNLTIIDLNSL